ncbi:MAG: RND family transporter [Proteobacteria bacterium]|nr:RND family transporter [Pseudomonadota bacterium]
MLTKFYDEIILEYPKTVLFLLILVIGFLGYEARKLEVDASAETLTIEGDKDLEYTRLINERYGNSDMLFVTFTPEDDLLADSTLKNLKNLREDLEALPLVDSVFSVLNVPLLQSPPKPVTELMKDVPSLETHDIDKDLARAEFLNSPIYQKMLVSEDFKSMVLQVNLVEDLVYKAFLNKRDDLRKQEREGALSASAAKELAQVRIQFKQYRDQARVKDHAGIQAVRDILDKYKGNAEIFLGGVGMIADDTVTFLKNDLKYFGTGVLLFLIIMLKLIFKKKRWIMLPIICCAFSVVATCGFLGWFGWEVTIISSNFISIQLIITMAITIHLIVRYLELAEEFPELSQRQLILDSVVSMAKPCLFATLTTIAGFGSLMLGELLPVINFGWMMSVGISLSLVFSFLIFPIVLIFLPRSVIEPVEGGSFALTTFLANLTEKRGTLIIVTSVVVVVFVVLGSMRLIVENSFIDYFKESTEIHQGMKVLDQRLGGTTPLDIIVDFKEDEEVEVTVAVGSEVGSEDEDEDDEAFDDLEEEFEATKGEAQYWFTPDKMEVIEKVHDYLDGIPQIGKVMSLGTMLKVGRTLNNGKPLDGLMLALIYKELPERFRKIVLTPYISIENDQVRFSVRVIDSDPTLRRNELLKKIKNDLTEVLGIESDRVHLTSFMVLYNNMLQSLFDSQILTIGAVIVALMVMFLLLFRSLSIAVIAILPNMLSVGVVLGFMGWVGIPLDMMTITIASISVGIAVDDTIHYIHRFIKEFAIDHNYIASMHRCHESIGYAMYYTSVTIIIGFSILITSNFIPSIYFGLLTGLAMFIALVAALSLLPQLIILIKPLGPDQEVSS